MRPRKKALRSVGVLAATLALPSCSFLLDFDSLQKGEGSGGGGLGGVGGASGGNGGGGASSGGTALGGATSGGHAGGDTMSGGAPSGGAGGDGGAGGGSAGAPEAGAGGTGVSCDCVDADADPCTVARCVDRGRGPECIQQPIEGLMLERDYDPIVAERFAQLGLVAGPNEFYLSALSTTGNGSNAIVYRFSDSSASVVPALDLGSIKVAGAPVSVPALAVDTSNGVRIHGFAALREAGAGTGARVWHFTLDSDFKVQARVPVSADYPVAVDLLAQTQQPAALSVGGETWGAWINSDGTVGVTSVGVNPDILTFGTPGPVPSTVSLLATRTGRPAVLSTVDTVGQAGGVFLHSEGGSAQLSECQSGLGAYSSSYAAATSFPGLWAMGWTKSGTGFLTSEGSLGLCPQNAPCATDPSCDANEAANFVRNPAVAAQHIQGDAPGQMYYVEVLPTLAPASSTKNFQAQLTAVLVGVDFGSSANLGGVQPPVTLGDPIVVASQNTTAAAGYRGPDHAAAAIVADTAAIAWVEPTMDGADRVRVQRYKMCLPR
ncbi:MAG TPA: hypothetical protein VFQ35_28560 [Polyangiaceae bacterium]|nr:hypothetical protein [Polyangiaceae bacterium]